MTETNLPGSFGMPGLGATIPILFDPLRFARNHYHKYGTTFKTRFLGKPTAVLLGAEAQRRVLGATTTDTQFATMGGYSFLIPFIGRTSLLMLDGQEHSMQRKLITPVFHSHHYGAYVERINHIIDSVRATWQIGQTLQFYKDSREITFRMANSLVLSVEAGPEYEQLQRDWVTLFAGITDPLQRDLPMTVYGRAMRAKQKVDAFLRETIARHRAKPYTDMLSFLLEAQHEDGSPLTEEELLNHTRFLLFASYDTAASTLSWALLEILQNPHVLRKLLEETHAERGDAPVSVEEIMQMPYMDAVIKETLRLHPATGFLSRGLTTPLEHNGYTIPAGWNVMIMLSFTHRMSEYFAEPEQFIPERFLAPRSEEKQTPYAWVGFGAGAHNCIGMGIAHVEIKTILARLLRCYQMTLIPGQNMKPLYVPINRPKSGTLMKIAQRV